MELSDAERASVLRHREVWAEENAALIKFGRQYDIPDGTRVSDFDVWVRDDVRAICRRAADDGTVTWRHVLDEEVCEAFAESDPARLRAELIQVAAVALRWIDAIDSRDRS